jgi:hypothetical protein
MLGTLRLSLTGATLAVLTAGSFICSLQTPEVRFITHFVKSGGWTIPAHDSKPLGQDTHPEFKERALREIKFASSGSLFLPRYYTEGDDLVLHDFHASAQVLSKWDCNGNVFAYSATLFGVEVASATRGWWIDRTGSGIFDEFIWSTEMPAIPNWAYSKGCPLHP